MQTNNGFMPLRVYYVTAQGDLYFFQLERHLQMKLGIFFRFPGNMHNSQQRTLQLTFLSIALHYEKAKELYHKSI